jgi:hypothetical protein
VFFKVDKNPSGKHPFGAAPLKTLFRGPANGLSPTHKKSGHFLISYDVTKAVRRKEKNTGNKLQWTKRHERKPKSYQWRLLVYVLMFINNMYVCDMTCNTFK